MKYQYKRMDGVLQRIITFENGSTYSSEIKLDNAPGVDRTSDESAFDQYWLRSKVTPGTSFDRGDITGSAQRHRYSRYRRYLARHVRKPESVAAIRGLFQHHYGNGLSGRSSCGIPHLHLSESVERYRPHRYGESHPSGHVRCGFLDAGRERQGLQSARLRSGHAHLPRAVDLGLLAGGSAGRK